MLLSCFSIPPELPSPYYFIDRIEFPLQYIARWSLRHGELPSHVLPAPPGLLHGSQSGILANRRCPINDVKVCAEFA